MVPPDPLTLPQDPDELFDIVDADGRPSGRSKRRADVHRDGDWHLAIHVWIMGADGGQPFLLFQRRSSGKDTWPNRLDATVGGHVRAGENIHDAMREIEEELGIVPDLAALRPVGVRRAISDLGPHQRDYELQTVYLLHDDRRLEGYRPLAVELAALVRVPLAPLLALLCGETGAAPALILDSTTSQVRDGAIHRDDLIPTADNYFFRVAVAAHNALRGDRYIAV